MNIVNKVSILYDEKNRERVVYLSEFLKWMGIMVNTRSYSMIKKVKDNYLDESGYYDYIIVDSNIPSNVTIKFNDDKVIYYDNNDNYIESILSNIFDTNTIKLLINIYNRNNFFVNDMIYNGDLYKTKEEKIEILHNYKNAVDDISLVFSQNKDNIYIKYILYSTMLKVNYINKLLGFFLVYEPKLFYELNKIVNNDNKFNSFYLLMGEYNKIVNCKGGIIPYYEKALDDRWNPINSQIYYKIASDISHFDGEYLLHKYNFKKLFGKIRNDDKFIKLPEFCENLFYYNDDRVKEEYEEYFKIEDLKGNISDMLPIEFKKYIFNLYQYNRIFNISYNQLDIIIDLLRN